MSSFEDLDVWRRSCDKDFGQFLGYATGRAGKLGTQLIIAGRLGYIAEFQSQEWVREIREISARISGLA